MHKSKSFSTFGVPDKFGYFNRKVCIFIDGYWYDEQAYKDADYRVLISGCEPPELYTSTYSIQKVIDGYNKFDLILAAHPDILAHCPNAVLFPFGSSWLNEIKFVKKEPQFKVGFLCGPKNFLPGHSLRHKIYNKLEQTTFASHLTTHNIYACDPKEKYKVFEDAQFNIIVENTQNKNYFTEKIVDCFMTKTIPLYWGCPNINEYFDASGIISFQTVEDLFFKLNLLDENTYKNKTKSIETNYEIAKLYSDYFDRVNKTINHELHKITKT